MAMTNELNALAKNLTWDLVIPPPDAHIIDRKWVFKLKRRSNETIERHKPRLKIYIYNFFKNSNYISLQG
jgi:hypothetical protein